MADCSQDSSLGLINMEALSEDCFEMSDFCVDASSFLYQPAANHQAPTHGSVKTSAVAGRCASEETAAPSGVCAALCPSLPSPCSAVSGRESGGVPSFLLRPDHSLSPASDDHCLTATPTAATPTAAAAPDVFGAVGGQFAVPRPVSSKLCPLFDTQLSTIDISGYQISARSTSIGPAAALASSARLTDSFAASSAANSDFQREFDDGGFVKSKEALRAELEADERLLVSGDVTADVSRLQLAPAAVVADTAALVAVAPGDCQSSSDELQQQQSSDSELSLMKQNYFQGFSEPLGALGHTSGVERPPFGLHHETIVPDASSICSTLCGSVEACSLTSAAAPCLPTVSPCSLSSPAPVDLPQCGEEAAERAASSRLRVAPPAGALTSASSDVTVCDVSAVLTSLRQQLQLHVTAEKQLPAPVDVTRLLHELDASERGDSERGPPAADCHDSLVTALDSTLTVANSCGTGAPELAPSPRPLSTSHNHTYVLSDTGRSHSRSQLSPPQSPRQQLSRQQQSHASWSCLQRSTQPGRGRCSVSCSADQSVNSDHLMDPSSKDAPLLSAEKAASGAAGAFSATSCAPLSAGSAASALVPGPHTASAASLDAPIASVSVAVAAPSVPRMGGAVCAHSSATNRSVAPPAVSASAVTLADPVNNTGSLATGSSRGALAPSTASASAVLKVGAACLTTNACKRSRIPMPLRQQQTAGAAAGAGQCSEGELPPAKQRSEPLPTRKLAQTRAILSAAAATDQRCQSLPLPPDAADCLSAGGREPPPPPDYDSSSSLAHSSSSDSSSSSSGCESVCSRGSGGKRTAVCEKATPSVAPSVACPPDAARSSTSGAGDGVTNSVAGRSASSSPSAAVERAAVPVTCATSESSWLCVADRVSLDSVYCAGTEVPLSIAVSNRASFPLHVSALVKDAWLEQCDPPVPPSSRVFSQSAGCFRRTVAPGQSAVLQPSFVPLAAGRMCVCCQLSVTASVGAAAGGSEEAGVTCDQRSGHADREVTVRLLVEQPDVCFSDGSADGLLHLGSLPEQCIKCVPLALVNRGRCHVPVTITVKSDGNVFSVSDMPFTAPAARDTPLTPPSDPAVTAARPGQQQLCVTVPSLSPAEALHQPQQLPADNDQEGVMAAGHQFRLLLSTPTLPPDSSGSLLAPLLGSLEVWLTTAPRSPDHPPPCAAGGRPLLSRPLGATLGRVHLRVKCREPLHLTAPRVSGATEARLPVRNSGSVDMQLSVSVSGPLCHSVQLRPPLLLVPPQQDRQLQLVYCPLDAARDSCVTSQLLMQVQPGGQVFEFSIRGDIADAVPRDSAQLDSDHMQQAATNCVDNGAVSVGEDAPSAAAGDSVVRCDGVGPVVPPRDPAVPCVSSLDQPPLPPHSRAPLKQLQPSVSVDAAASKASLKIGSVVQCESAGGSAQLRSSHSQLVWLAAPAGVGTHRTLRLRNCSSGPLPLRLSIRDSHLFSLILPESAVAASCLDLTIGAGQEHQVALVFSPTSIVAVRALLVIKPRRQPPAVVPATNPAPAKLIKFSIPLLAYSGQSRLQCVNPEGGRGAPVSAVSVGRVALGDSVQATVCVSNMGARQAFVVSSLCWDSECRHVVPPHQCIISPQRLLLPPDSQCHVTLAFRVPGSSSNNSSSVASRDRQAASQTVAVAQGGSGGSGGGGGGHVIAHLQLVTGDEILRQSCKRSFKQHRGAPLPKVRHLLAHIQGEGTTQVAPSGGAAVSHTAAAAADCLHEIRRVDERLCDSLTRVVVAVTGQVAPSVNSTVDRLLGVSSDMTSLFAEETCVAELDSTIVPKGQ